MMVSQFLDRPIAFHRVLVRLGAGVTGAVMLSQALYWSNRTSEGDGWFYKTQIEWEEETGLTRYEQEGARKKLKNMGIIEEIKKGVPCKTWYRVNFSVLDKCLIQYAEKPQTRTRKTSSTVSGKTPNSAAENQQSITENTHRLPETTTLIADSFESTQPSADHQPELLIEPKPKKPAAKASQLPDDFAPTEQHVELAAQIGVNLATEWPQFCDYHRAKGSRFKDWHAALRTWIRNAAKFGKKPACATGKPGYFLEESKNKNYWEGVSEDGRF